MGCLMHKLLCSIIHLFLIKKIFTVFCHFRNFWPSVTSYDLQQTFMKRWNDPFLKLSLGRTEHFEQNQATISTLFDLLWPQELKFDLNWPWILILFPMQNFFAGYFELSRAKIYLNFDLILFSKNNEFLNFDPVWPQFYVTFWWLMPVLLKKLTKFSVAAAAIRR